MSKMIQDDNNHSRNLEKEISNSLTESRQVNKTFFLANYVHGLFRLYAK